jgi:hypothetical protein
VVLGSRRDGSVHASHCWFWCCRLSQWQGFYAMLYGRPNSFDLLRRIVNTAFDTSSSPHPSAAFLESRPSCFGAEKRHIVSHT